MKASKGRKQSELQQDYKRSDKHTLGITYGTAQDPLQVETQETLTIPLYKGIATLPAGVDNIDMDVMPTFTGDVAFDESYTYLIITGDGTMSAKGLEIF